MRLLKELLIHCELFWYVWQGFIYTYFWTRWAISRSIVTSVVLLLHLRWRSQVGVLLLWVVSQVSKNHALFIIILAENLVVTKEKTITNAKSKEQTKNNSYWLSLLGFRGRRVNLLYMSISVLPVITLLARETFQMVDVGLCSHHHFEGWDHFVTCTTIPSGSKEPEIQRKQCFKIDLF